MSKRIIEISMIKKEKALKSIDNTLDAGCLDSDFAEIIYTALTEWCIPEQDFRDSFGLTKDAVHRWSMRQNLPQPDVRPVILKWLKEQL